MASGGGDGIELVDTIVEAKGAGAGGAVTLLGTGFVPSGLTILTLLWLGLIAHHA